MRWIEARSWSRPRAIRAGPSGISPQPPKASKHPDVRYFDIHEEDELDVVQLTSWIEQASRLPGEEL